MSSRAGPKRKAAADAGGGGGKAEPEVYAILCTRTSSLIDYDEDSFIDCYGSEVDDAERAIDEAVVAGDGSWLYNMPGGSGSSSSGRPTVFRSKEGANARAATLWVQLQRDHPFVGLANDDDEDDEEEEEEEEEEDANEYKTMSRDGLACWEREREYYVDPYGSDLRNRVSSTLTVEVVPVNVLP